jgi:hypothetical protein
MVLKKSHCFGKYQSIWQSKARESEEASNRDRRASDANAREQSVVGSGVLIVAKN